MAYVYMMTNKKRGTLYVGVTADVVKRVWEHKSKAVEGFTKRYNLDRLVYVEEYAEITSAIAREKQLKKWLRFEKIALIERDNPEWDDVYATMIS